MTTLLSILGVFCLILFGVCWAACWLGRDDDAGDE